MSAYRFAFAPVISLFILLVFTATAARADLALVLGNRNYQRAGNVPGADSVLDSASALRRAGYQVIASRNAGVNQTRRVLGQFIDGLDDAERAVVVLSGHFVRSAGSTWFLASDAGADSLADLNYNALSLRVVLDLLARKPGGAVLFLGAAERAIATGPGLEPGIGALDIPQGVLVVTGRPTDIDRTIRRDFLQPGTGFRSALANAPASVSGQGFVSDLASLVPQDMPMAPDGDMLDDGYWQAVQDIGTEEAMRAYLRAFPRGLYAARARDWIAANRPPSAEEIARQKEAALGLTRSQRRAIQRDLTVLGYDTRGIDGIFGRATRGAISGWQADEGLEPSGYLTRRQLDRLSRQAASIRRQQQEEEARRKHDDEASDRDFWIRSGAESGNEQALREYVNRFPTGLFVALALARLAQIEAKKKADRDQAALAERERQLWRRAVNRDVPEFYYRYLDEFPNGKYAKKARKRIEELTAVTPPPPKPPKPGPDPDVKKAAMQEEQSLNLDQTARQNLEKQLKMLNFDPGPVDGVFDRATRKAVRAAQRVGGLPETGYFTRDTIQQLNAKVPLDR